MKGEKRMKKTVLALLILSALLMLFSCSSDKVEPPTPTRPDLDLPLPNTTEDPIFGQYPPESLNWEYDPDPYDEVKIYGGAFGNNFVKIMIENGSCSITVEATETVSNHELYTLGITEKFDIAVKTTYTVNELMIISTNVQNQWTLFADNAQIIARREYVALDNDIDGVNEYCEAKYEQLKDAFKSGIISDKRLRSELDLLHGFNNMISNGKITIIVELDNKNGTCSLHSARWNNENGYECCAFYTYGKNKEKLKSISTDIEYSKTTIYYRNDGVTVSSKDVTEITPDGRELQTKYTVYIDGNVKELYELEDGWQKRYLSYYGNGQIEKDLIFEGYYYATAYEYYEDGKVKVHYYIEDGKRHQKTYYEDGQSLAGHIITVINPENYSDLYMLSLKEWYENGVLMHEIVGNENGYVSDAEYYGNGQMMSYTSYRADGTKEFTKRYDYNGSLINEYRYDEKGDPILELID